MFSWHDIYFFNMDIYYIIIAKVYCVVLFPGEPEVGKSSIFLKYIKNQFDYEYKPTRKVSIRKYMYTFIAFIVFVLIIISG